jgi:hypothetical protein
MSKKIILGVIGFIGVGLLFLVPVTHAATIAPEVDLQTRTVLGQALNVLQGVLNQINARISNPANPIANPQGINASLGGIKSTLVAMDAYLRGTSPIAAIPQSVPASVPVAVNPYPVVSYGTTPSGQSAPQTATVSWFVGPKLLLILLPILILAVVARALFRKKEPKEIMITEMSAAKTPPAATLPAETNSEIISEIQTS